MKTFNQTAADGEVQKIIDQNINGNGDAAMYLFMGAIIAIIIIAVIFKNKSKGTVVTSDAPQASPLDEDYLNGNVYMHNINLASGEFTCGPFTPNDNHTENS